MDNTKTSKNKVDLILEKKQALDKTIHEYEKRIDEKLASIAENELPSPKLNPSMSAPFIQEISIPDEHYLSGVDISDDAALDQAVLNSKPFSPPGNKLAFEDGQLAEEAQPSLSFPNILTLDEDDEIPTLSKILGRIPERSISAAIPKGPLVHETPEDATFVELPPVDLTSSENEFPESGDENTIQIPPIVEDKNEPLLKVSLNEETEALTRSVDEPPIPEKDPEVLIPLKENSMTEELLSKPLPKETVSKDSLLNKADSESVIYGPLRSDLRKSESPPQTSNAKTHDEPRGAFPIKNLIMPALLFVFGVIALGGFLIFASQSFTFVDYSVLFILFTCLIFALALPYSAGIFLMLLLFCSYVALTLISVFYIGVPFELYQIGWIIIIPLVLWSASLLVSKIKTSFAQKKTLANELASIETLEDFSGLTIEKAYYKDLKSAMERANKGETILVLEMISIAYSEAIKPIIGPRLFDEILYKTLNIIKKHCFNTHLIYILDGHIFSVLMENTSVKNQLMINQGIIESFNAMLKDYDSIDVAVELDIVSLPFSREIKNPFDYRSIGTRLLKK